MLKLTITMLALLCPSVILASPLPDQPHVYVEGSGKVEVEPDTVTFGVSFRSIEPTIAAARISVEERSARLIGLLQELEIPLDDVAATTLRIFPAFDHVNGRRTPIGVSASRQVEVTLRNLERYSEVMAAFVDAEISETISTTLSVSEEKSVTDTALESAVQDARQRANRLAVAQNMSLGSVHSISEFMTRGEERYQLRISRAIRGQASNVVPNSVSVSAMSAQAEWFEPQTMTAHAQVYVVYLLNDPGAER